MMDEVRGPEEPALLADAVEPVVAELVAEKEKDPSPPLVANVENGEAVKKSQDLEEDDFREEVDEYVAEAHGDAGCGVLEFVEIAAQDRASDGFRDHQQNERGDGQVDQVGH